MGRYSVPLSPQLADLAGVTAGQRVLDVGCGPGALTAELVRRVGAAACRRGRSVRAVRGRGGCPQSGRQRPAGRRRGPAVRGRTFDASLAQLVVHFMTDPVAGLAEMARVTRPGGVVAACVWDFAGDRAPLSDFWAAARELDPDVDDESRLAGVREGHLVELMAAAGLREIAEATLVVKRRAPDVRRVVAAVPGRRWSRGLVRRWAESGAPGRAARALSSTIARCALRPDRVRVGGARSRLGRSLSPWAGRAPGRSGSDR